MGAESFVQVRALDDATLRQLLERGRPEQRVWAIWALAQHAGEAAGQLAGRRKGEPDPDARCRLAEVLGARGKLDLLTALARHDPSTTVRAAAIHLVTRIAVGARAERGAAVRAVLEAERRPAMVTSILRAIDAGAPEVLVDLAGRALGAASLNVQLAALAALLKIETPAALAHARRWLMRHPDRSVAFDTWLRAAGEVGDPERRASAIELLAPELAGTPVSDRAALLQRLEAPPWSVVALLVAGSDELLRFALRRSDIAIPARVLAAAILRGLHAGVVERLTIQLERGARGRALLEDVRRAFDLEDARPALVGLRQRVGKLGRAWKIAGVREVLAELARQHPVEHLMGLENALVCWLADGALDDGPALRAYCELRVASPAAAPVGDARSPFEALLAQLRELEP